MIPMWCLRFSAVLGKGYVVKRQVTITSYSLRTWTSELKYIQWSFEKGKLGYKIRSRATGMHVSVLVDDSVQDGDLLRARAGALEFDIYRDEEGAFRYAFLIRVLFDKA
jgi:hypothetical protein